MKKTQILKIAGGVGLFSAASVTTGLYVLGKGPAANLPWHITGSKYKDPRSRTLSCTILTPNPRNRQPRLIELNNDLSITLSFNKNKLRLRQSNKANR